MSRVEYHKPKKSTKGWILGGLFFALFLSLSSILLFLYPFASTEKVAPFTGENPIIFNGKQEGNAIVEEDSVYVPLTFMKNFIDDSIHFDEKSNSIIITTKDKVVQMPSESLTYYVNEKPVEINLPPLKDDRGELYLALEPILAYYPIQFSIFPQTNGVFIQQNGEEVAWGTVKAEKAHEEKLRLRTEPSLQSPYTAQTHHLDKIMIENEQEEYVYVRTEDGSAGYLPKKYVERNELEQVVIETEQREVNLPKMDGPIQLTWEAVYTKNPATATIPAMPGVNVVSPTWFELTSADGEIKNLGSLDYIHWAKNKGYQVWALFSNGFDSELTHLALKDFETRQTIIRKLLHYSQMYQLDGINIDIENVNPVDGPLVTQFMREATPYFHEAGLVVSMDITFIAGGNWSAFYERDQLATIVDYLIVMAYDEHWGSSPVAGSVASLPWVEKNLQKLLEIVPNEKLMLGVPMYARLWQVADTGEVSSKALSMEKVKEWLEENQLVPLYDEATEQNYAEIYVPEEKSTYKIWLEDELSLQKRADLVVKYELAGVGSWSRFFADESAWTALDLTNKQVSQK